MLLTCIKIFVCYMMLTSFLWLSIMSIKDPPKRRPKFLKFALIWLPVALMFDHWPERQNYVNWMYK